MRFPWSKPWAKVKRPEIPAFKPIPPVQVQPLQPKDPDIIVTESELTQTGMWRLFPHKKPQKLDPPPSPQNKNDTPE